MYLSKIGKCVFIKLQNIYVSNCKIYLSQFVNIFVSIWKHICPNFQMYLSIPSSPTRRGKPTSYILHPKVHTSTRLQTNSNPKPEATCTTLLYQYAICNCTNEQFLPRSCTNKQSVPLSCTNKQSLPLSCTNKQSVPVPMCNLYRSECIFKLRDNKAYVAVPRKQLKAPPKKHLFVSARNLFLGYQLAFISYKKLFECTAMYLAT